MKWLKRLRARWILLGYCRRHYESKPCYGCSQDRDKARSERYVERAAKKLGKYIKAIHDLEEHE